MLSPAALDRRGEMPPIHRILAGRRRHPGGHAYPRGPQSARISDWPQRVTFLFDEPPANGAEAAGYTARMRLSLPLVVLALVSFTQPNMATAGAKARIDGPAFSLSAKELRALAANAPKANDVGVVILFDEGHYRLGAGGVVEKRFHQIFLVVDSAKADGWESVGGGWAPWMQNQPTLRARVLSPKDSFHELDPKTFETPQLPSGDAHTYSDWRSMRVPLPAFHTGSLVEWELVITQNRSLTDPGDDEMFTFGATAPVAKSRVTVEYPNDAVPRFKTGLFDKGRRRTERDKKRSRAIFELDHLDAYDIESYQPTRLPRAPYVSYSTVAEWKAIAGDYERIIAETIESGPLPASALAPQGNNRDETIRNAVAQLHTRVRYTGLEFGQNAVVPWSPAVTWKRQYGDCKDKATVLITMLRQRGIAAHVALLASGGGFDDPSRLPGLDQMNHAIVYVPAGDRGEPAVWIDATDELARPGQLRTGVQGRAALIARKGENKLVVIPRDTATGNAIVEHRTIQLANRGPGAVSEVSTYFGAQELQVRDEYRGASSKDANEQLGNYLRNHYAAQGVAKVEVGDARALSNPYSIRVETNDAGVAFTDVGSATLNMNYWQLLELVPPAFREHTGLSKDERGRAPARRTPLATYPSSKTWHWHVVLPQNLVPEKLPNSLEQRFGPVTISIVYKMSPGRLDIDMVATTSEAELTAANVNRIREAFASATTETALSIAFVNRAAAHSELGRTKEAVAEIQRQRAERPSDASLLALEAYILARAGLAKEAKRRALEATKNAPGSTLAWEVLGISHMYDDFGRYHGRGWDRAASIAALERAASLSPNVGFLHTRLAVTLAHDERGFFTARDASRATKEFEAAGDVTPSDLLRGHALLLLHGARYSEGQAVAERVNREFAQAFALATIAASTPKQVAEEAARLGAPTSHGALLLLAEIGDYNSASRLAPYTGGDVREFFTSIAHKVIKVRSSPEAKDPQQLVRNVVREFMRADRGTLTPLLASGVKKIGMPKSDLARIVYEQGLPADGRDIVLASTPDVLASLIEATELSRAGPLSMWALTYLGKATGMRAFVMQEGGRPRFIGFPEDAHPLAREIVSLSTRRRAKAAATAMEWMLAMEKAGTLKSHRGLAPKLWSDPGLDPDLRVRLTAALYLVDGADPALGLEVLSTCPDSAKDETRQICMYGRVAALVQLHRVDDALQVCELFARTWPKESLKLEDLKGRAILGADRWSKQASLALEELIAVNKPGTAWGAWMRAIGAVASRRHSDVEKHLGAARANLEKSVAVANNTAWLLAWDEAHAGVGVSLVDLAIADGNQSDKAVEHHTRATLVALTGDLDEAMKAVRRAAELRSVFVDSTADWLVYGKVAEKLGYRDAALEAFNLVISAKPDENTPWSTTSLARFWVEKLGAAPSK